ncbi:hypothetical protein MMC22_004663 [Lobaria immixta]|nr:hypothetical protein [Lobaria immixta]
MERFEGALNTEDFTDIDEHLSQTPESFYSGKPILYYSCLSASLVISRADLDFAPLLLSYADASIPDGNGSSPTGGDSEITIAGIDIWVTSEDLKIYFHSHDGGITIPYPAISLHAIQPSASPASPSSVYLQILKEIQSYDDHDPESTISVTLIPTNPTSEHVSPIAESDASFPTTSEAPISSTDRLFAALTDCANLHPDPTSDSDSEAGGPAIAYEGDEHFFSTMNGHSSGPALPPPMPGSGGWITAENVRDFYDEDGNPRVLDSLPGNITSISSTGETLGNGAGSVRARDEDGDATGEDVRLNGDETKWRRTE